MKLKKRLMLFLVFMVASCAACGSTGKKERSIERNYAETESIAIIEESSVSVKGEDKDSVVQEIATDSAKKNTDELKIEPYVYPQEFTLGTNLEGAITELALSYDNFDTSKTKEEDYPEFFVDNYCQNSRMSFDYLNQIAKENKGIISREQIEYMQYSLTNEFVDFKNIVPEEGIDYYDSSSGYSHGDIISYDAQVSEDETKLIAEFVIVQDYSRIRTIYELNIILVWC